MKKVFDSVIAKWLQDSVADEDARKQFSDGMERLIKETKADNGVWTVACAASQMHASKLEEIERLRTECDTLKAGGGGGAFRDEASRKRGRDEPAGQGGGSDDIWATFQFDSSKV
jgi:hypothetical protein